MQNKLINRLEDSACPGEEWQSKLTGSHDPNGLTGRKTLISINQSVNRICNIWTFTVSFEDSNQTAHARSLIRVFIGCTCNLVGNSVSRSYIFDWCRRPLLFLMFVRVSTSVGTGRLVTVYVVIVC